MWHLRSLARDQTHTPALEGEVPTTGLPGKFLYYFIILYIPGIFSVHQGPLEAVEI